MEGASVLVDVSQIEWTYGVEQEKKKWKDKSKGFVQ